MARRRKFLDRPFHHLSMAAAVHATMQAYPLGEGAKVDEAPAPAEPSAQSKRSRAQRRQQGGKFG